MPSEYLFVTNVFFLLKSGAITISDDIFTTISAKLHWWQKNAITGRTIKEILHEKSRHCEIYKLYYMPMKIKGRCLKRESIWRSEPNLLRCFAPITIKTKFLATCTKLDSLQVLYVYLVHNQDNIHIIPGESFLSLKNPFKAPSICKKQATKAKDQRKNFL